MPSISTAATTSTTTNPPTAITATARTAVTTETTAITDRTDTPPRPTTALITPQPPAAPSTRAAIPEMDTRADLRNVAADDFRAIYATARRQRAVCAGEGIRLG